MCKYIPMVWKVWSWLKFSHMMNKHVKLLRLGKKNARKITAGSLDPAAIAADSGLDDPL